MTAITSANPPTRLSVVPALGEAPAFHVGDRVRIAVRFPIGHYRVPHYVRGKHGVVQKVLLPRAVHNEEEAFGRNAGQKGHYYRVGIPMADLWPDYAGPVRDHLVIEVFETWLEKI